MTRQVLLDLAALEERIANQIAKVNGGWSGMNMRARYAADGALHRAIALHALAQEIEQ